MDRPILDPSSMGTSHRLSAAIKQAQADVSEADFCKVLSEIQDQHWTPQLPRFRSDQHPPHVGRNGAAMSGASKHLQLMVDFGHPNGW